ncbi:ralA-binding protein 1 [Apis mellifera caucasica]|uniref:RalA-binding protein 1 n=1 Tax=Apis mellifera TaxID=7460 RepID=A0A7M7GN84_APIME|nr:ralA-binding protein 1 [Apis mellifera]KAG6795156.1 ralA-binding protein 1 [Apis mellifera caucasica]KAG9428571.1 ralA-binding protein 1 [Apis mellifera carnica]|eukprot:XP_006560751.3 ralA-binding protein 1 [Apis mellifera]
MDFESPDVEKEFPGLYASESAKKSNESDFSDEGGHEKHSKKELLGGKRKEKKDRKDRGYATLEGESSPDEDQETKSPSKSKKTKAFKFPSKKEKREKSREKEGKEKDGEKEKDKKKKDKDEKDIEKEKRKEKDKDKTKQKFKDRKKGKHTAEDGLDIGEGQPVFGVSLHLAVERSRCHDGIDLPLVVRDCIDFTEEHGMNIEGLYKVPGVKSKVQHLKKLYNHREFVNLSEFEPTVATSLLILFLRELPEPVLESSEMISRFEQAASTKDVAQREAQLLHLTQQLPKCNNVLLAWIILHLDHVTIREKTTKMNAQTISMTLSPVLQMSHRLLLALLFHCKALFPNVKLTKYVPPLSSGSINLPDSVESITAELSKQESLLSQIHMQMNAGFVTKLREEQLWEVQRMITQLKRKYKTVQKMEGAAQKSLDEEVKSNDEIVVELNIQKTKTEEEDIEYAKPETQSMSTLTLKKDNKVHILEDNKEPTNINIIQNERNVHAHDKDIVDSTEISTIIPQFNEQENISSITNENVSAVEHENAIDKLRESLIYEELLNMQALLKSRINQEKNEIKRLMEILIERGPEKKKPKERAHSPNEAEMTAMIQLVKENQLLEKKMTTLIRSIIEEKDACIELRVQLAVHQLAAKT